VKYRGILIFGLGMAAALALGWIAFPRVLYRPIEQPIQFSHKVHTGEAVGMACEDCHALSEDGRFAGIPTTESCAGCHSEPVGESENEKRLVDDFISKNREIPWLVYSRQPENVYFSHAPHLKLAEMTCESCHGKHGETDTLRPFELNRLSTYSRDLCGRWTTIRQVQWRGMKMDDCSNCHIEKGVEQGCLTCHK
jgi:menaquinone reductase, multiheme cytochrome c subunit